MKRFAVSAFVVLAILSAGRAVRISRAADDAAKAPPAMPAPEKEHEWLAQLAGEWAAEGEMFMEPGKPPIKNKGVETARAIGGFWIVAEHKMDFMGQPMTGILTLGYDAEQKKYLATWIDSMTGHLWKYDGTVDAAGKALTLTARGPCPDRPGKLSTFKEVIEVKDKDNKTFTSSIQNEDGTWTVMMKITSKRTK
jgi:hypothetical protein